MSLSEDPTQEKASVSDHKRFMEAVGSIQYIAAVTRPDIAYAAHPYVTTPGTRDISNTNKVHSALVAKADSGVKQLRDTAGA